MLVTQNVDENDNYYLQIHNQKRDESQHSCKMHHKSYNAFRYK